jgi:hypothetical protein
LPRRARSTPAALIAIGLGERECFLDAQHGAPEDHDQRAESTAVCVAPGGPHDGDDLLDVGRIGRAADARVARRTAGVERWHGGGDRRGPARSSSAPT